MIKLDLGRVPDGFSHSDIEADASELEACLDDGYLESPVTLSLDLNRRGSDIFINGTAGVRAVLGCSRCLKEYSLDLETALDLWCIVGGEPDRAQDADMEDVLRVPAGAKYVDLADPVRSELLVLLPLKPLCSEECRGLCPRCGTDLNVSSCSCHSDEHDSRWDALKDLK